jgi:hypothetical protein
MMIKVAQASSLCIFLLITGKMPVLLQKFARKDFC